MGANHPERPARLQAIEDALKLAGLFDLLSRYEAPQASKAQLTRVHTKAYVCLLYTSELA